jgi:hypothetical protein
MGMKLQPGNFDCYGNAEPDEPMFILLARDIAAPLVVEEWANRRERMIQIGSKPESDRPMVDEARECAKKMREWRALRRDPGPLSAGKQTP